MFNDISWWSKDNEIECESNCQLVSLFAKRFGTGHWSFLGPGSEKSGILSVMRQSTRSMGQHCWKDDVQFGERGHPVFRATSPLSRGQLKSKGGGKLSIYYCADLEKTKTSHTYFCKSAQSLRSSCRNVWRILKPFTRERCNPLWWGNRVPHSCPVWSRQKFLWIVMTVLTKHLLLQQYGERIEKLSQPNWANCVRMQDFLNVVEIGQYFMTKDTAELFQFHAVACREYTFPRDEESSPPKGWIQGNTKIGPVLEVATCYLHGKYGVEIRTMSMNRQFSLLGQNFSRINKFVMKLSNDEQEFPEVQLEEYASKTGCEWFCMPIMGFCKTTKTRTCRFFHKNCTYGEENLDRCWTKEIFVFG